MKTYELTYIISPEITLEEAEAKSKEIESVIQSKEGTILKQSNPTARTLAFPIGKRASGFFGVLEFKLEPEKLLELKEIVAKDGKIIRHMVIIKEPLKIKKMRRARIVSPEISGVEPKTEIETIKGDLPAQAGRPASAKETIEKEKVELKDIEQKLEELLG
jgi:small subunit ribosomal protein S6